MVSTLIPKMYFTDRIEFTDDTRYNKRVLHKSLKFEKIWDKNKIKTTRNNKLFSNCVGKTNHTHIVKTCLINICSNWRLLFFVTLDFINF